MDRDTRNRLKALLLGLPCWARERERAEFVRDALWEHRGLRDSFRPEGEPATVAGELVDLCAGYEPPAEGGTAPLCALLAQLREAGAPRAELAALTRTLGCGQARPTWAHDPYPGLLALDHWQAPIFFGRTAETRDLLGRLTAGAGRRFLLVTGASGAGKSSLVRAGVWATLAAGAVPDLPGAPDWLITAMFPAEQGGAPFSALTNSLKQEPRLGRLYPGEEAERLKSDPGAFADLLGRALADRPAGAEWLLILDQLEELFTPACADLRAPFLDLLLAAVEGPRFRVIATVRSDFLGRCIEHPGLLAVMNGGGQFGVRAPGPLAMTRMVTGPAEDLDLADPVTLDPGLVAQLVDDAVTEPGGLALLAFALKDLYGQCRASGRMDLDAYRAPAFGGLKGVIARRADRAFARAGADAAAALPRVFSRLLTVQADGTATRRREDLMHWADDPAALTLIDEFSRPDTRLLVRGPDGRATLEIAHEALLREWPRLAAWIEDRREALRLCDRVEEEARAWVRAGRPRHRLWRHEVLDPARRLLAEADLLGALERDPAVAEFLIPEAEWLLAELLCNATDHARREAIGMRLSEVGDPRPGVGVIDGVPDILWCEIPEGEVFVEEVGTYVVASFRMAAYPVTYSQYKAFLNAKDGYHADLWHDYGENLWRGLTREQMPGQQLRSYANHPADSVSWNDATAFCRWLSARLGYEVRLPDEWEWQWAAQSARPDFAYPWGAACIDAVANTDEVGFGRTTPVGVYPKGRSLQGAYDLSGNVWEWCRNGYGQRTVTRLAEPASRVVRGGSWSGNIASAGARSRGRFGPRSRNGSIGFRLVRDRPIR